MCHNVIIDERPINLNMACELCLAHGMGGMNRIESYRPAAS